MILNNRLRVLHAACGTALAEDRAGNMMRQSIAAADRGEPERAINLTKAILANNPRSVEAAMFLAVMQPAGSVGLLNQAIMQEPHNTMALWYLAIDAMCTGKPPFALALLEAGSKSQPSHFVRTLAGKTSAYRSRMGSGRAWHRWTTVPMGRPA